jgi:GAF domain-containing protein
VAGRGFPEGYNVIGSHIKSDGKWSVIDQKRGSLIISDAQADSEFEQWDGSEYIRSWMGVAMIVQGKIIGYLFLDSRQPGYFSQRDATMVETFASSAAVAIENGRLFTEEQEQRQRSMALLDLMRIATSSLELDKVLKAILSYTTRLIPSDSGSIQLLEKDSLRVATEIGLGPANIMPGKVFPVDHFPINEEIINKKQPIRIADVTTDNRFTFIPGAEKIRSFLGVPITIKNKAIGLINLDNYMPDHFSDSDMVLALAIGNHAAFAIENARLFEAEQQRHRESETLRQAALAITTSLDLESVLETILIVTKQVIPFDSASVFLEKDEQLHIAATQGFSDPDYLLTLSFPVNDEFYQEIKNSGQPIILGNAQNDERFHNWGESDNVKGWIGVPLSVRGETIGCITIDSQEADAFNMHSATLAQAFANQAASAIQNAQQFETEQRHLQESETLRQAAEAITSTLDIQQVLNSILDNLNLVVPFESAGVFLIENDKVRLTAVKGLPDDAIDHLFPASNALLQEVWNTKSPLILSDAQNDSRFESWVAGEVHGWMSVPLIARGVIIGYITIDSSVIGAYDEHDATLAITFAHQAAAAIENARLYERGEQQIRQLTILRDIDSAISSSFDLQVTLNLLIGHIIRELDVDAAAILLYDPDFQALSLYASAGLNLKRNASLSNIRIGGSLAGQVALNRKFLHIPNLDDIPRNEIHLQNIVEEDFTSYIGFPLIGKGQIKGVLEIYTRREIDPSPDWLNFLQILAGQAAIAIDNVQLFKNLQRSNQELILAYDITLEGWGKALELRDKETQGHTDRVVKFTVELARRMGVEGEELTHIMRGVLLHDIGKLGVPDSILQKAGPLTEEEWDIMRQHPQYAYNLINSIAYLRPAIDIPYYHHERWDGSGYPLGLKGEGIPLAARIFAVIDIWDALLNKRVYRDAWPEEKVIEYLKNTAGIELDPNIVEKFLKLLEEEHSKNPAE